jgi:predicted hotdog family 3-hydroxylacyl-ACP dehydratase
MLKLGVRYRVEELVPHRGTMSLLESIDDYGADWLRASLTVRRESAFADERGVPGWVGIEYMAQAASAFGAIEQVQRGATPSIGLLIGSRYYRCMQEYMPFGSRLSVLAKIAMRDEEDFAAYECSLHSSDPGGAILVADCTLKAFRPRDLDALLPAAGSTGG